jgi:glycosyltransferase involved in cell wall biosynthesis
MTMHAKVLIVQESLPQYRVPFFDSLRDRLAGQDIALDVAHGRPPAEVAGRGDGGHLDWSIGLDNRRLRVAGHPVVWQPVYRRSIGYDLVIVEQASRLLVNYPLLARQRRPRPNVALWGQGADRPAGRSTARRVGRAARSAISRLPHWWFAYTEGGAEQVRRLGFPAGRITVVQNAADTSWAQHAVPTKVPGRCVFIGSLYRGKGIDFLVAAADRVASQRPEFSLVIVGDGPERSRVDSWAADRPYLRATGPLFGRAKAAELTAAQLVLAPGMVGLAVVDSFAAAAPMVTTDMPFHGPEVEYLEHGRNGWIVPDRVDAFAEVVETLLGRPDLIIGARAACRSAAERYSLRAMTERFAGGVAAALGAGPRVSALGPTDRLTA